MLDSGNCKPNAVTFGTLVKGHCLKGNNTAAIQLLKKMEGDCKPDLVAYSTVIDSLCKDTLVVDAMKLFSEMTSKGIAPRCHDLYLFDSWSLQITGLERSYKIVE
ncbi:hypothetical protein C1H46_023605 [Malus baccata]|uniref:Pentatricopeptide repeat-containing protein n=1 Tax=Malus baccata TaxID=106549 RepID=A0A540LWN9_MALBA|nr:hypothetical protein C1H46_023605 [Malus baccata]